MPRGQSCRELANDERTAIYHSLLELKVNARVQHGFMKALCEKYSVTRQAISRIWIQGQRSLSAASGIPLATLWKLLKSKAIRRRSSRLKPMLTEHHKAQRMSFVRGFIKSTRDGGHSWHDMLDRVHIDEKWFYITKLNRKYYLWHDEDVPHRKCHSKAHIQKVMFVTAVARPRYDPAQRKMWDGKEAKRTSKNRVRGTPITVPMTVTKDIYRRFIIEHVIPSIRLKWPGHRGNTIYIQKDNARPHVSIRDPDVVAAGALHGWDIRLDSQPPMSPDFNVLDLGFFNAIQSLQHQKMSRCIEDLVAAVHEAYVEMDWKILDKTFMTLQNVMKEAFKANGDNVYALPHASKDKTRKTS
ncbi:hypothetical protein H257_19097 [Aphanomyces astaci]|uniref:Tc1-like transposase DDE domain-containing protein n=1 Tax=Aphanomyces astaci TaxID=112090 RepID=W4FB73_APHAT|nr:hypothetical protein H257_19097 [Aphanomyces astaci]ETV63968.1 hypothetical protein H257_19097 [Aphanomyces astaci]|eukprot:XP_009846548.1 hypothetical protein H257_19097 [Aphanomyces astaci]